MNEDPQDWMKVTTTWKSRTVRRRSRSSSSVSVRANGRSIVAAYRVHPENSARIPGLPPADATRDAVYSICTPFRDTADPDIGIGVDSID
jgi:hypothetical protein